MTDYADLEKRLREAASLAEIDYYGANEDVMREAADAIAALAEALQPFARVGETFVKTSDDPLVPWGTADTTRVDLFRASAVTRDYITAGDMRRAARYLSRAQSGQDETLPKAGDTP